MKRVLYEMVFREYLKNGSIDFQTNNGNKAALIRPFYRHLNLENRCRNKEMSSYFKK